MNDSINIQELTLEQFLDFNIKYLHQAVEGVPPGGDLPPTLLFIAANGEVNFAILGMGDKAAVMAKVRRLLHEVGARQYALITASWVVILPREDSAETERLMELIQRHGTRHPETRHLRKEVYVVSAGDLNG